MYEREIELKVKKLPESLKKEVLDYVDLENIKDTETGKKKFKFDWEGELSDMRREFTSVELQHKTMEWR